MKTNLDTSSYIKSYPSDVQIILNKVRATIKAAAPKAEEGFKYGLPTFILDNVNLVHFGGFKKHVGFYPTPAGIEKFIKELSKYTTTKGAIQFPLDKKIPYDLISKITKFRVKDVQVKHTKKNSKKIENPI